jgi:protein-S-isoprenylcysteine O-methyltransferase Ste14
MSKKTSWIQALAFLGAVGVPFFAGIFFALSEKGTFRLFFLVFIVLHSFERVWKTFYTPKERRPCELHGDWTLIATTPAYIVLCFLSCAEGFIFRPALSLAITVIGVILYAVSFRLRWWGMKALGSQWAVHAIGAGKASKEGVIRLGPCRYIHHPICAAIFLEVLSIPLILNSILGFLFALCLYIPLQYTWLPGEERNHVRKVGESYVVCMNETRALFPWKALRRLFSHEPR